MKTIGLSCVEGAGPCGPTLGCQWMKGAANAATGAANVASVATAAAAAANQRRGIGASATMTGAGCSSAAARGSVRSMKSTAAAARREAVSFAGLGGGEHLTGSLWGRLRPTPQGYHGVWGPRPTKHTVTRPSHNYASGRGCYSFTRARARALHGAAQRVNAGRSIVTIHRDIHSPIDNSRKS